MSGIDQMDGVPRSDAAEWPSELAGPPDLADSIAALSRRTKWNRRTRMIAAAVVSVVAAVALAFGVRALMHGGPTLVQPAAPKSVTVNGESVPYGGNVPWANAIDDPSDPDRVYLFADNDAISGHGVCPVLADHAYLTETATAVVIRVVGYGIHNPSGECDGAAHAPVRTPVALSRPLAQRQLIDATTGDTHRILAADTVPTLHNLPSSCTMRTLRWDETSRVATRTGENPLHQPLCYVDMAYGPDNGVGSLAGADACFPVKVNGVTASCGHDQDSISQTYYLRWRYRPRTAIRLVVGLPAHVKHGFATALNIARSIR